MALDSKIIVMVALVLPTVYVLFGLSFNKWLLILPTALGVYYVETEFVSKKEVMEKRDIPNLGPQAPFMNPHKGWEISPDGTPIPKYQPPPSSIPPDRREL